MIRFSEDNFDVRISIVLFRLFCEDFREFIFHTSWGFSSFAKITSQKLILIYLNWVKIFISLYPPSPPPPSPPPLTKSLAKKVRQQLPLWLAFPRQRTVATWQHVAILLLSRVHQLAPDVISTAGYPCLQIKKQLWSQDFEIDKIIEAQIWCESFPKTMKNWKV